MQKSLKVPPAIRWRDGALSLLDQRCLPDAVQYLDIPDIATAVEAIKHLSVRGAPAIGIAAAYALAAAARKAADRKRVGKRAQAKAAMR